jgi:hypothetical protein
VGKAAAQRPYRRRSGARAGGEARSDSGDGALIHARSGGDDALIHARLGGAPTVRRRRDFRQQRWRCRAAFKCECAAPWWPGGRGTYPWGQR